MCSVALKLVICGTSGRMGQALVQAAGEAGHSVVAGLERKGCIAVGQDVGVVAGVGVLGAPVHDMIGHALAHKPDVVIDFSHPDASMEHARSCASSKMPIVIGTTGFTTAQRAELEKLGHQIPLVVAPNMSVGVNVVIGIAAELARKLGEGFDVEILEAHHKRKKDSPSGTALKLAEEIAAATGRSSSDFRKAREGQVGERPPHEIGIQALRGGDVVGEHTVFFLGEGERVELSHRATSREQFARGALRAAAWVQGKAPGLYDMRHVLGFA
jgi:4-hydroxy-tetrahydrodipicolinate reductase